MNDLQYRAAIKKLDLTQGQAAKFFGVSTRTSNAYANGTPIPDTVAKLLRLMIRLKVKVSEVK